MRVATLLEPNLAGLAAAIQEFDSVADAFEIRLDAALGPIDPVAVRRLTQKPLIATCRRPQDGGRWSGTEEQRMAMLDAASLAGFNFIDLEVLAPHLLSPDLILRSYHNFQETPSLADMVRRAQDMGKKGSHLKFATQVNSFTDTLTVLELARALADQGYPASVMGLGDFPRLIPWIMGTEFVYGGGRTNAPGQPSLRSLDAQWAFWGRPRPARLLYLVVGEPVDHSLSPLLFNTAFRALSQTAAYAALRVRTPVEFSQLLGRAASLGLKGINVTSPLKEPAFRACTSLTPEARRAQSVNCIRFTDHGPAGHNTDGLGAAAVLRRLFPGKGRKRRRVLLVGSGGAARGILSACAEAFEVTVAGRNRKALEPLGSAFDVETVPLDGPGVAPKGFDCAINATTNPEPLSLKGFDGALFDLHYGPNPTPWHIYAQSNGLAFAGGRDLLLEQAVPGFEFLTGWKAPRDAMERAMGAYP